MLFICRAQPLHRLPPQPTDCAGSWEKRQTWLESATSFIYTRHTHTLITSLEYTHTHTNTHSLFIYACIDYLFSSLKFAKALPTQPFTSAVIRTFYLLFRQEQHAGCHRGTASDPHSVKCRVQIPVGTQLYASILVPT